jgi:hypothetical protein
MNIRVFLATFFSLLVAGSILGGKWKPKDVHEIESSFEFAASGGSVRGQDASDRIWLSLPPAKLSWSVARAGQSQLKGPMGLKVDSRDHSFVTEYAEGVIHEFSPEGRFIRTYKPKGHSPDVPASLTDVAFGSDNSLYVVNAARKEIEIFDNGGGLSKVVRPRSVPYHMSVRPSGQLTLLLSYPSDFLFATVVPDSEEATYFGKLTNSKEAFALDGWIEADGVGGFVYAGIHSGFIAAYNDHSKLRYIRKTIDGLGLPKLNENSRGRIWVDPDWPRSARGLSITDDKIYILAEASSGPKRVGAIDIYDLQTGRYLYSRRLPEACSQVFVTHQHIYTLTDAGFSQWDAPLGRESVQVASR